MRFVIRDIHELMKDGECGKVLITRCHGIISHADCFRATCTLTPREFIFTDMRRRAGMHFGYCLSALRMYRMA